MTKTRTIHDVDFRVPNTRVGKAWIKNLRLYTNREKYGEIVPRTRGPRESGSNTQCTHEDAVGYAVYLRASKAVRTRDDARNKRKYYETKLLERTYQKLLEEHQEYKQIAQALSNTQYEDGQRLIEQLTELTIKCKRYKRNFKWVGWIALVLGMASFGQSMYLIFF